jgi:uncharacterized protein YqeY
LVFEKVECQQDGLLVKIKVQEELAGKANIFKTPGCIPVTAHINHQPQTNTMNLEAHVMAEMKEAMKNRNESGLRGLRAIKAEIIKAKTEPGAGGQVSPEGELKLLQKMIKQRRDALDIYKAQNRADLAQIEQEEIAVIERFLPAQLGEAELRRELEQIIAETGAASPADMGKVMGLATKKLAGRADGKAISAAVKALLLK